MLEKLFNFNDLHSADSGSPGGSGPIARIDRFFVAKQRQARPRLSLAN
jgi:hypothetical protein